MNLRSWHRLHTSFAWQPRFPLVFSLFGSRQHFETPQLGTTSVDSRLQCALACQLGIPCPPAIMLGTQPEPGSFVMEIQPEKEGCAALSHNQIVPPESILAVETQPEKEAARRFKFHELETWVGGLLGSISAARAENSFVRESIQRIGTASPADVQLIAASNMELLAGYYQIALTQSYRIFFWTLLGSGVGLIFFVAALGLSSGYAFLSGAILEIIAGMGIGLYGKTTAQLSGFRSRLEDLQRYVLVNSLCEALDGDERNRARAALIEEVTRPHQAIQNRAMRPANR